MLEPFLSFFGINPTYNLEVLKPNQSLASLSASILDKIYPILMKEKPEYLFVQGDTTTAAMSALAGFYNRTSIVHVEAGLRTHDKNSPFPEEVNRKIISGLADWHFAPTELSKANLLAEGINKNIFVTGNTGIDALRLTTERVPVTPFKIRTILVTCHRRENFGVPLVRICDAILRILEQNSDVEIVFPVHLNPNVQAVVKSKLAHPRFE